MPLRALSLLVLCTVLAACGERTALHSHLSEEDANEVIAELADKHVQASKQIDKDGITVLVDPADMNSAVRALDAAGLPRRPRSSLGEIFRKEGVISTPMEERARYLYALSQELESTLSQIDGVVLARVHVVLPERVAPGEPVQPASASVFIKHTSALDPDSITPRVRSLVASSLPGMADIAHSPGKLSVVFVPAALYQEQRRMETFGPFLMPAQNVGYWKTLLTVSAAVLLCLVLALAYATYRYRGWIAQRLAGAAAAGTAGAGQRPRPPLFSITPAKAASDKGSSAP